MVIITEANIHYKGSITIDEALMDAANLIEFEWCKCLILIMVENRNLCNKR